MSDRKTDILIAAKYPSENEFNGSVESFARSNLKIEGIESLVRSITSESINATANGNTNTNLNKERAGVF